MFLPFPTIHLVLLDGIVRNSMPRVHFGVESSLALCDSRH
jgi:hypothetical protein